MSCSLTEEQKSNVGRDAGKNSGKSAGATVVLISEIPWVVNQKLVLIKLEMVLTCKTDVNVTGSRDRISLRSITNAITPFAP